MAAQQHKTCPRCLYFERTGEGNGECHRYAPHPNAPSFVSKVDAIGTFKNDIHWPKVYDRNWCGEFAPAEST